MTGAHEISVLHVDDDPALAELTAEMLSEHEAQFTVETATSAREGLDRLATDSFDCIVSDYEMPGQNGIEFLETVREKHPDLPFILYTAKGSEAVASDAIAAGVTDYLQKESGTSQYTVLVNKIRNAVERYRQRERAQATRGRLRQIIDLLPQLVFVKDEAGEFLLANEATAEVYGTTVSDLEGATDADFADSEEEVEAFRADDQAVIESGEPKHVPEESLTTADGETRLFETTKIPYDPVETNGDAVLGVSMDITERKEREAELEMQSTAMEAAMDGISILNEDGEYVYMNQAHADVFEYDADELLGSTWQRLYDDDEIVRIEQEVFPVLEREGEWRGETVGKRRDGSPVSQEITLSLLDDGKLICTNRDITTRKKRERTLNHLQQRTQELMHTATNEETAQVAVEAAHDVVDIPLSGCHLVDDEQRRLEPAAVVDTVREEIGDAPTYERTADDAPAAEIVWQAFENGEPLVINDTREYGRLAEVTPARSAIIYPLDDYGVFIVSATEPNAFDDTDTTLTEIIATSLKTALRRVEREQTLERQNDRLNEFTSVVSHDLRNPLNVATGRLELAIEECDSDHLDGLEDALDRMEVLIDELLTLAREGKEVTDAQPVHLATIADECWENVETNQAKVMTHTDRGVQADRSRLKQVFANLFRNAVEHGRADVTVTIGGLDDGFYIEDDGPGIPSDEREAVFEAGYSQSTDGTGFGLSIVEQIVTAHDWQIRITDGNDGGARFEITNVEFVTVQGSPSSAGPTADG